MVSLGNHVDKRLMVSLGNHVDKRLMVNLGKNHVVKKVDGKPLKNHVKRLMVSLGLWTVLLP